MEKVESIVDEKIFISQLTYLLKLTIFTNKSTFDEDLLERCIRIHNKYKSIENEISDPEKEFHGTENEILIRKCIKRMNLIFKTDQKGNVLNLRDASNQSNMSKLNPHPSIPNGNVKPFMKFVTSNEIDFLQGIPFTFVFKDEENRYLLWQYARSLYYMTQLFILDPETDLYEECTKKLMEITIVISTLEEKNKLKQKMAIDKFLNTNLINLKIKDVNIADAKNQVKNLFGKKGLSNNNTLNKMIDSVTDQLQGTDLSNGNIVQNMFGIARSVASEMQSDMENDPNSLQNTIGAITSVFQEAINDEEATTQIPDELKNLFGTIVDSTNNGQSVSEDDLFKALDSIAETSGMEKDEFYKSIRDDKGNFDISKVDDILKNLQTTNE